MTEERFVTHVHAHKLPIEITSPTQCLPTCRPHALVWSHFRVHSVDVFGEVTLQLGLITTIFVPTRKPLGSLVRDNFGVLPDMSLRIGSIATIALKDRKTIGLPHGSCGDGVARLFIRQQRSRNVFGYICVRECVVFLKVEDFLFFLFHKRSICVCTSTCICISL